MDGNAHKRKKTEMYWTQEDDSEEDDSQDLFSAESRLFRKCVDNLFLVEPIDEKHGNFATKMVDNLEDFEKYLQTYIHRGFEQDDLYESICKKCKSLCAIAYGFREFQGPFKQTTRIVLFLKIMARLTFHLVRNFKANELHKDSRKQLMMCFNVIHSCMKSFNIDDSISFEKSIMGGQIWGAVELTSNILRLISDEVQDESVVYNGLLALSEIVKDEEQIHEILDKTSLRDYISSVNDTFKGVVHIVDIATCIQDSLSTFDKSLQGQQYNKKTDFEKIWEKK